CGLALVAELVRLADFHGQERAVTGLEAELGLQARPRAAFFVLARDHGEAPRAAHAGPSGSGRHAGCKVENAEPQRPPDRGVRARSWAEGVEPGLDAELMAH